MSVGKRWFSLLLILAMILGMLPFSAFAADTAGSSESLPQFSDMPDNWSTAALQNAVENGLLNGSDGKIMPDSPLTRAQMAAVIARAFGAGVKGDISAFSDVKSDDWFYDSMAKAYQMKVINGSDGKMNPHAAITRQEVFVILARAFRLEAKATLDKSLADADQIASWAKGEVNAFVNAGYIQGSGGYLNPTGQITRAEFAQVFDNILKEYINEAGIVTEVPEGNIMVNVPGVTLKNLTVKGDLIIGDGVGDGEAILEDVTVTGRMVVRGGGTNSIIIRGGSSVGSVVVSRVDGEVSVKVQGDASVEVIYVDDGSDDVIVEGTVGNIEVAAPGITLTTSGATIGSINVTGENTNIVVSSGSSVGTVTTSGSGTQITGSGTVTKVEAQSGANNTKVETPNTQITVGTGVTGVTGGGGTAVEGGSTVNNNSSGTGTQTPTSSGGGGGSSGDDGVSNTITLNPTTGSATVARGEDLPESTVTLTSNYNASGLTTVLSLTKDGTPVDFNTVFSSYKLSTAVGSGSPSGPYEMNGAYSSFTYGTDAGYSVTSGVSQVTTVTGKVMATAPTGTYVVTTKVKYLSSGSVVATGTYNLTVTIPEYNGGVSGVLTTSDAGAVSGTLSGDYDLTVSGNVTAYTSNRATFTGTVTGDINGSIEGTINSNGVDTLSGTITADTRESGLDPVRIVGIFPQNGTTGSFEGEIITGPEPTYVDSMTIESASDTVTTGDTLQMSVDVSPDGASDDVIWSVWSATGTSTDFATIDKDTGLLTGVSPGTVVVIAKALDGSLKDATKTVTVNAATSDASITSGGVTTTYPTIQEAVAAAATGDTIKVRRGIDLGSNAVDAILIDGKTLTLDLNGYTITSSCADWAVKVATGASLTINDGSAAKTGIITNTVNMGECVRCYGTLTINGGTYTATGGSGGYALIMANRTTPRVPDACNVTINGGTFSGWIYDNGTDSHCTLTINDGIFNKSFYLASAYTDATINDGTFVSGGGNSMIEIKAGTLTITGGTFTNNIDTAGNATAISVSGESGPFKGVIVGVKTSSSGITIDPETSEEVLSYASPVTINISGGTFTNSSGDAIVLSDQTAAGKTGGGNVTATISGDADITGNIVIYDSSMNTANDSEYFNASTLNITGGRVDGDISIEINASGNSAINITGGTFCTAGALNAAVTYAETNATISVAGQIGSDTSFTVYNVETPVTIQGAGDAKPVIYGTFHVYANGVSFDGLEIRNRGGYPGLQQEKAAIDVLAKQVSITDCDFVMGVDVPAHYVANGVTIWPMGTAAFSLTMSGNTFTGYDDDTDYWSSCAFQIAENIDIDTGRFTKAVDIYGEHPRAGTITTTAGVLQSIAEGNEYRQCSNDFIYQDYSQPETDRYKFVYATNEEAFSNGLGCAREGTTVVLAAGTYTTTSQIILNKPLTITGVGDNTILTNQSSNFFKVDAEDVTISNLRFLNCINASTSFSTVRAGTAENAAGLTIDNVTFENGQMAINIFASPTSGDNEVKSDGITITNSRFIDYSTKGIYLEKGTNVTITNNVFTNTGSDPNTGNPLTDATGSGIDINLKYGDYSNYTITGNTFVNCGQHPTSVNGAAILLKARGTGNDSSYSGDPATLTNVIITGNTFNKNKAVLILGEADKDNTGPDVVFTESGLDADNTLGTEDNVNTAVLIDNRSAT